MNFLDILDNQHKNNYIRNITHTTKQTTHKTQKTQKIQKQRIYNNKWVLHYKVVNDNRKQIGYIGIKLKNYNESRYTYTLIINLLPEYEKTIYNVNEFTRLYKYMIHHILIKWLNLYYYVNTELEIFLGRNERYYNIKLKQLLKMDFISISSTISSKISSTISSNNKKKNNNFTILHYKPKSNISQQLYLPILDTNTHQITQSTKYSKKHYDDDYDGYDSKFIINAANTESFIYTPFKQFLTGYGIIETNNKKSRPFLLWLEMMENYEFDKKYFNTECYIMNQIDNDKSIITNKYNLYYFFKSSYPNEVHTYMPESWNFKTFQSQLSTKQITLNNNVYIVRPAGTGAFTGKDIYIVNNNKTLNQAIQGTKKYKTVLITRYIVNPLLFESKKFHLRIYYLVGVINGYFVCDVFNFYKILTAKLPFKNVDYGNPEIHDTHLKSTGKDIICPDDFSDYDVYMPKIKKCLLLLSKSLKQTEKIKCYNQSQNGFEIFGCDFMITTPGEIVLLEINDKVGYKVEEYENYLRFSNMYFKYLQEIIFKPLLENGKINPNAFLYHSSI